MAPEKAALGGSRRWRRDAPGTGTMKIVHRLGWLAAVVVGDLPLHCLLKDAAGDWEFQLGRTDVTQQAALRIRSGLIFETYPLKMRIFSKYDITRLDGLRTNELYCLAFEYLIFSRCFSTGLGLLCR